MQEAAYEELKLYVTILKVHKMIGANAQLCGMTGNV